MSATPPATPATTATTAAAPAPVLFIDRDGTLIEEPPSQQVDRLEQVRLLPGVIAALTELRRAGYRLVMVSNQDGLGSDAYPIARFEQVQEFLLQLFASQGVQFEAVFICPHFAHQACECRKPLTGLVTEYLRGRPLDRARSAMIGDRDSDEQFARNLGIRALRVQSGDGGARTWAAIVRTLLARRGEVERITRETEVHVTVQLDSDAPSQIGTGIGFFDHMLEQLAKHAGFQLTLSCRGDLHIDEHHTVEDCALALGEALRHALGDKAGIGRYGFLLAMDESEAQVALDLSGRALFL
ncbi:MAG: histidinol-phosphatase, partial [Steroidobacteraceae bacterium]